MIFPMAYFLLAFCEHNTKVYANRFQGAVWFVVLACVMTVNHRRRLCLPPDGAWRVSPPDGTLRGGDCWRHPSLLRGCLCPVMAASTRRKPVWARQPWEVRRCPAAVSLFPGRKEFENWNNQIEILIHFKIFFQHISSKNIRIFSPHSCRISRMTSQVKKIKNLVLLAL